MRYSGRGALAVLALVAGGLSIGLAAAPAHADEAVDAHVSLSLTALGSVAVDNLGGWVYVTGAPGDDDIVAVKPDGSSMRQIPVVGATNLAVSTDGSTLAASLPAENAIAVVDTANDGLTLYPLGANACPS